MSQMECPNCGKLQDTIKGNYLYIESGLDNVTICGVDMIKCDCGEETAIIPRILELHKSIAECLLGKKIQLTGKEIRFLRKNMGLKGKVFARLVGIDKATLSRWENGKSKSSSRADRLIRILYAIKMKPEIVEELAEIKLQKVSKQPEIPIHVMADKLKQYSCVMDCR